ncbi:hypothetical protein [Aestuariivivens sediminicola]|uniref:hypothetical protein n=1 Tax=Aestuariivivens sediminicola TaxID=2913560 RepID=UPI001F57ABA1|nr:hypothetical protein [Aestuariivivens sediminicola]
MIKNVNLLYLFKFFFLVLIVSCTEISNAQRKDIVISEYLSSNSDMMKVKMGTQWFGRIMNFKFGDYAVLRKSRMSPKRTEQKSNFLGTKNQYETRYKFDFLLSYKDIDTALVEALYTRKVNELYTLNIIPIELVLDEIVKDSINFTADISLRSNSNNNWKLFFHIKSGTEVEFRNEGILIKDDRTIWIKQVSSNRDGNDKRRYPALGYEFLENGNAICAVQYFGGGALGYNKNRIWIDSNLNEEMKLILAASMVAIMQLKLSEMSEYE